MFGGAAAIEGGIIGIELQGLGLGQDIHRPRPFVRPFRPQELERADGVVADGYAAQGCVIPFALNFKLEPHHELAGLAVEHHLGPFEGASFGNGAGRVVFIDLEGDSPVGPMVT